VKGLAVIGALALYGVAMWLVSGPLEELAEDHPWIGMTILGGVPAILIWLLA
jgi:hypothetical protein